MLYVDGRPRDVAVGEITTFPGGSDVRCEVDEPSLALNVMSRNGTPIPSVRLVELRADVTEALPHRQRALIVILAGAAHITTSQVSGELAPFDAVDCRDSSAHLDGVGRAALILL